VTEPVELETFNSDTYVYSVYSHYRQAFQ